MLILLFKVFPPAFRELPPPPLELFDLDETFSSEKARLAEITNKCRWSRLIVYTFIYKVQIFGGKLLYFVLKHGPHLGKSTTVILGQEIGMPWKLIT